MTFTVAVLLEDLAYGGAEEGGWYYGYGYPVNLSKAPQRRFKTYAKAWGYLRKIRRQIIHINYKRPEMSSVLSKGRYKAYIFSGKPRGYPDQRPHYC